VPKGQSSLDTLKKNAAAKCPVYALLAAAKVPVTITITTQ